MNKIGLIVFSIVFICCSPTMKVKKINLKNEKLPTLTTLEPEEILVEKDIDINEYSQFLFVKAINSEGIFLNKDIYNNYILKTLINIGEFKNFYTQNDLEKFVIQNGLTEKITNISDNIGLFNLSKNIGKFLICECNFEYLLRFNFRFDFKIINPMNSEILFHIRHNAINWGGLDRPLFNPVFNKYIDWIKTNTKKP